MKAVHVSTHLRTFGQQPRETGVDKSDRVQGGRVVQQQQQHDDCIMRRFNVPAEILRCCNNSPLPSSPLLPGKHDK